VKLNFKKPFTEQLSMAIADAEIRLKKTVESIELTEREFHQLCYENGANWFEDTSRTFHGIPIITTITAPPSRDINR
jgi:hypothetical protein